jgi:16S rRNA processing protein RimM
MNKEEMHCLGKITRLHGYKGELTVFLDTAKVADYKELKFLFLEIKGSLVPYKIELFEPKTNDSVKVRLAGVNDEATAKSLLKSMVYVRLTELSVKDEDRRDMVNWVGYDVFDQNHGNIGVVEEVVENRKNPQLEIRHNTGKLILLPLQPEFVLEIDDESKTISTSAPEGLIELYLE